MEIEILDELRVLERERSDLLAMRTAMVNRGKARCRDAVEGGDKLEGARLYAAIAKGQEPPAGFSHVALIAENVAALTRRISPVEKRMEKIAQSLPVWQSWGKDVLGFGPLLLARIVAEAGDLSGYANPAKLWKRFGLGRFEIAGEWYTQRRFAGKDKAKAIAAGFKPRRRAIAYLAADCIIKKRGSELNAVYHDKKADYLARDWTKLHAHRAASRYLSKRLFRELWKAWRKCEGSGQLCAEIHYERA